MKVGRLLTKRGTSGSIPHIWRATIGAVLGIITAGAAWLFLVMHARGLVELALTGAIPFGDSGTPYEAIAIGLVASVVAALSPVTAVSGFVLLGIAFFLGHTDPAASIPTEGLRFYLAGGIRSPAIHLLLGCWSGVTLWHLARGWQGAARHRRV